MNDGMSIIVAMIIGLFVVFHSVVLGLIVP